MEEKIVAVMTVWWPERFQLLLALSTIYLGSFIPTNLYCVLLLGYSYSNYYVPHVISYLSVNLPANTFSIS